jgi:inner membrane protein
LSPITHFLLGWLVASTDKTLERRDRALVTVAGVIPDTDGLGIVAELATRNSQHPLNWWSDYHHVLGHNLGFALLVTAFGFAAARQRWKTALLIAVSFHLHLLCDLVGARGPDGDQWPITYLQPFSRTWEWTWSGQWALNAWPNMAITAAAIAVILYLAARRGYSPVGMFSRRSDAVFIETIRRWFGIGTSNVEANTRTTP